MSQEERLASMKEAAEILCVSLRTVARQVGDGSLPSVLIGRRRLVRRDALRDFIGAREK